MSRGTRGKFFFVQLSTLLFSLREVTCLSNQFEVCRVLDQRYGVLRFLPLLGHWGPDFDFERPMRTARQPVIAGWINVEMFANPLPCRSLLCAPVTKWCLEYAGRRELNVPFPPVLAYLFHHMVAETGLREDVCRVTA